MHINRVLTTLRVGCAPDLQRIIDDFLARTLDDCAARKRLEIWVKEFPDDISGKLVYATFCSDVPECYAVAGQTAIELQAEPRAAPLRTLIESKAKDLLEQGRSQLRSRTPQDGVDKFDQAIRLIPNDPAYPMAAGLALARANQSNERPTGVFGIHSLDDLRKAMGYQVWLEHLTRFFRQVIALTTPTDSRYGEAVKRLIREFINSGNLPDDTLDLIQSLPDADSVVDELVNELAAKIHKEYYTYIATLLRAEQGELAAEALGRCIHKNSADPKFYLFEAERCIDHPPAARRAYKAMLKLAQTEPPRPTLHQLAEMQVHMHALAMTCRYCGKTVQPPSTNCQFCDMKLERRELVIDKLKLIDAPPEAAAHAGLAYLYYRQGDTARAQKHRDQALALLPDNHPTADKLHELIVIHADAPPPEPNEPARRVFEMLKADGATPDWLATVNRINERSPRAWSGIGAVQRAAVIRACVRAGRLKLAFETFTLAFGDALTSKTALNLKGDLDRAAATLVDAVVRDAGRALDQGRAEETVQLTNRALELRQDARLLALRGQARELLGHDLIGLEDYFAAAVVGDEIQQHSARKAAAGVLERRWDIDGARAILNGLNTADPDIRRANARLLRRERGEPVIVVQEAYSAIMEDTLLRREQPLNFHGYFALAVREVGVPLHGQFGGANWFTHVLEANFEFVRVLGALRDVMGGTIFALRTISAPHLQIPERGKVTVALLARVSAPDAAACRARALQLWLDIHAMLPLAQESVYIFEPVVDEDELTSLLKPFPFEHGAEIVRRELLLDGVYTVHPFTSRSLDLHNMHWMLLRQHAPAMISIHLKPTNLLPWERSLGVKLMHDAPELDDPYQLVAPNGQGLEQQLVRAQVWEKLQQNSTQLNSLRFAYLLRVYVAGSAGTSQLLPEMAAAALFGPMRGGAHYGGCEIERVSTPSERTVIENNLRTLDVESWLLPDDEQRARYRYLVGEMEAAAVFRLPIPGEQGVPGMSALEGRPVVPPTGMPIGGTRLGVSVARMRGVPMPITQGQDDRRRHAYVVGKTGMGKSTLLMTCILQDIEHGRGVFLLDPHGDLCEDVLARIPAHRADDVILIDPSDDQYPIGFNILDAKSDDDRNRVVNDFIGMLIRLYDPHNQAIVGPIFQQTVRNAMLAAMSLPDGTLIDVYQLLADEKYARRVIPYIKDPLVKNYWQDIAAQMSNALDSRKAELLPYLLSKFSRFVEDGTLRRMIGQPRTSIDWDSAFDDGKIVLVNLAKGRIGQETSHFIGSLVLSAVLQAAFRRGQIPAARRREFFLYIDEVQNYATPMLATMLSEGRKFGVVLTIANQFLHQLDHGIREAVFGNVGSLFAFRLGTQDAPALAPEFYPSFSASDLINLPQFTACVKLLIDGVAARPFSMRTLPAMTPPNHDRAAAIRAHSRERYGTDIETVEREILTKLE